MSTSRKSPARRGASLLPALQHGVWTLASTMLAPLWLAGLGVVPRLRLPLRERLGAAPRPLPATGGVHFHAASAGDVRAVVAVARAVAARRPELALTCTVQTRSGLEMALRLDAPMHVVALPLDGWPWIDRFVARLRPAVLVLEYLELWPRLVSCARRVGAAVVLQNGRLHPDRMRRYRAPGAALLRAHLAALDLCIARSPGDAERFAELGVASVRACPHTKHALVETPSTEALEALCARHGLAAPPRGRTWIAGSVHADELATVLDVQAALTRGPQPPRLVLCPRYPGDGARAAALAARRELTVARLGPAPTGDPASAAVWVVETVGELATWYATAAAALIGGTLGARGGQNPVEPAAAGCRLVVGPSTRQIDDDLTWLDADGVTRTTSDVAALTRAVDEALRSAACQAVDSVPPGIVASARETVDAIATAILDRVDARSA